MNKFIHSHDRNKELSNRLDKLSRHISGFIFQYKLDSNKSGFMPYVSRGVYQSCGVTADMFQNDVQALSQLVYEDDLQTVMDSIDDSAITLKIWKARF